MSGAINRQSDSYRHGVVLGLTMAEIMVLLVFCLLIAMAMVLAFERSEKLKALQRADNLASQLAQARGLDPGQAANTFEASPQTPAAFASEAAVAENWRRLVEARETVSELAQAGINPSNTKDIAEAVRLVEALKERKLDPRDVVAAVDATKASAAEARFGKQVAAQMSSEGLGQMSPHALVQAAKEGLAARSQAAGSDGHKWPPIINLSEAEGHFFSSGSAGLDERFSQHLKSAIPEKLLNIARDFEVDVIEVIGHTDEQPLSSRPSNLDKELPKVLAGGSVADLKPADNAGLGLARALAVANVLSTDPRLAKFRILPLSGAQLIDNNDRLSRPGDKPGDVKERRRIEIRMRKTERP